MSVVDDSRTVKKILMLTAGVAAIVAFAKPQAAVAQERIAVDRWLVSTPFPADPDDPMDTDYLAGPGEVGVLPDRGRTVSGADWKLVRSDSAWVFPLPTVAEVDADSSAQQPVSVVSYAHAYIRSPEDRTVRLLWGGQGCTPVSAWLNGRRLDSLGRPAEEHDLLEVEDLRSAVVRLGRGYNTLLIKAARDDCPFGVAAGIEGAGDRSLDGIRVQASRPYGDTRTGPEQWIVAGLDAGPEAVLAWQGEELFGAAAVRLSAFSVTAVERAELKATVDGRQVKRQVDWLEPAQPRSILVPFEFAKLRRAGIRGEGLELEIKWPGGEWKGVLAMRPEPLLEGFLSPVRLLGWSGPRAATATGIGGSEETADPHPLAQLIPLPNEGETLVGEWKVPGWLSGFSLVLVTDGAPGSYRLASVQVEAEEIVLCQECRKGQSIQIVVEAAADWTEFPGVVIVDAALPVTDLESPDGSAAQWLEWIDEKGSRRYRERAAEERAATPAGPR